MAAPKDHLEAAAVMALAASPDLNPEKLPEIDLIAISVFSAAISLKRIADALDSATGPSLSIRDSLQALSFLGNQPR